MRGKKFYSGRILMLLIIHQDMDKAIFVSNELAHLKFLCFHFRRKKKEESQKDERTKEATHRKTESLPARLRMVPIAKQIEGPAYCRVEKNGEKKHDSNNTF